MVPFRGMGSRVMAGLIGRIRKWSPIQCSIRVGKDYTYARFDGFWPISPFSPQPPLGKLMDLAEPAGRVIRLPVQPLGSRGGDSRTVSLSLLDPAPQAAGGSQGGSGPERWKGGWGRNTVPGHDWGVELRFEGPINQGE